MYLSSRLLAFDETSREITVIASSSYHDHCVLKTSHVILQNDHVIESTQWPVRMVILSAATDGKVAFWDITEICREFSLMYCPKGVENKGKTVTEKKSLDIHPFFALELHQSGINSIYFGKYTGFYFKDYILFDSSATQ